MELDEVRKQIQRRVVFSGRVVFSAVAAALLFFSVILGIVYLEFSDAEQEAAAGQIRTFVISNTENFQTQNTDAIKKAALRLVQSPVVSHMAIFRPTGPVILWVTSPKYLVIDSADTGGIRQDLLKKVQKEARLASITSASDMPVLKLESGMELYRAFLPVRKGAERLGDVEMGFFKSEISSRAMNRIRIPGAASVGCVLILMILAFFSVRKWEKSKALELSQFLETQIEQMQTQYKKQVVLQKREYESKELEGGSFFNILESVRDISGAPDLPMFVRRSVLASVRLFRCRMVSFYMVQPAAGDAAGWKLMGRYDGKGYFHDIEEALKLDGHVQLKEALNVGATELLENYPFEGNQSLLISVTTDKNRGAILLTNKAGAFDNKDVLAGRVFSGFLPNLLAWHAK